MITFDVDVPVAATTDQTFARFRWSTTSGLDTTTAATDGEVEDYAVTIDALPTVLDFGDAPLSYGEASHGIVADLNLRFGFLGDDPDPEPQTQVQFAAGGDDQDGNDDEDGTAGLAALQVGACLLYTSPSPRDQRGSRMPSSA